MPSSPPSHVVYVSYLDFIGYNYEQRWGLVIVYHGFGPKPDFV